MTTPTYQSTSTRIASDISSLFTKQTSSIEELLDNALTIEQLLVNPSKPDINRPTCTQSEKKALLSMMITGMRQVITDVLTSLLVWNKLNYANPTSGTIGISSLTDRVYYGGNVIDEKNDVNKNNESNIDGIGYDLDNGIKDSFVDTNHPVRNDFDNISTYNSSYCLSDENKNQLCGNGTNKSDYAAVISSNGIHNKGNNNNDSELDESADNVASCDVLVHDNNGSINDNSKDNDNINQEESNCFVVVHNGENGVYTYAPNNNNYSINSTNTTTNIYIDIEKTVFVLHFNC